MRTQILLMLILIIILNDASAQLVADAGTDKGFCTNADNVIHPVLGADTVATGGIPPYTYKWEADDIYQMGSYYYHKTASYFLNDTTLPNPTMNIGSYLNDEILFRLTVTDANNQVSMDTMVVLQSYFSFTLDYWEFTIDKGDWIYLEWGAAAYSDRGPFEHYWHPTHGLDDSTSATFWAHPEYSISYACKVTDALGCYVDRFRYRINVIPVATNDIELLQATIFPNPANNTLNFKLEGPVSQHSRLNIFTLDGTMLLSQTVQDSEFAIDVSILPPGDYLYRLISGNKKVYAGLFVKK